MQMLKKYLKFGRSVVCSSQNKTIRIILPKLKKKSEKLSLIWSTFFQQLCISHSVGILKAIFLGCPVVEVNTAGQQYIDLQP